MAALLIVEDDRKTNEAICEYLKSAGHEIIPAYDGAEGLQIFGEGGIDLVVLDIMLPKVSGLSVLHEIRQKSLVPILMLTAVSDEYTQVTSFDEQADDYITKPFSMILLGRRITALLRRSGKGAVPNSMTFGDVAVNFSGYTAKDKNGRIDITPKEIDLLKLLVEHKGLVLIPQKGEILFDGKNILQCGLACHRRSHVSLIFQSYNLIDYMTTMENVALTAKKDAMPLLLRLGLTAKEAKRNVMKLSGGQQQRVAIARALASDTPVILADEPTGNLDEDMAGEITDILKESAHELNKCVIVVTHSNELAAQADIILQLKRGSLYPA